MLGAVKQSLQPGKITAKSRFNATVSSRRSLDGQPWGSCHDTEGSGRDSIGIPSKIVGILVVVA